MYKKKIELAVGVFVLLGILSCIMLAFQVSGLHRIFSKDGGYVVYASFQNIGGLKARSRVTVAGVKVGSVKKIGFSQKDFSALVTLYLNEDIKLPTDTSASILTSGLIGDNYISLEPGAEEDFLKAEDSIEDTHSAVVLEQIIGQFLYSKTKE